MTPQEMVEEYREELLRLTANNKAQINLLTILAEDYKAAATELVRCIEQVLAESPAGVKIIVLYVIDSIVKNIPSVANYKDLFTKNIVKTFTHVFQESDERQRVSLYKLRNTWNDVFPKSRLYAIDTKINAIDKNWPVASLSAALGSSTAAAVEATVVKAGPGTKSATNGAAMGNRPPAPETRITPAPATILPARINGKGQVHVNPKFYNTTKIAQSSSSSSSSQASPSETPPNIESRRQPVVKIGGVEFSDEKPKAAPSVSESVKGYTIPLKSSLKKAHQPQVPGKPIKNEPVEKMEPDESSSKEKIHVKSKNLFGIEYTEKSSLKKAPQPQVPGKPIKNEPVEKMEPDESSSFFQKSSLKKRQRTPAVEVEMKRPFVAPAQVPHHSQPPPVSHFAQPPPVSHFAQPTPVSHLAHPPSVPQPTLQTTMALGSHAFVTTITPAQAQPHPSFAVPPPPVSRPPVIEDKTTRLSGVPLNNRIFVEGRAYEVFYLENVAVIERNGVPHRVSFNGPPRDIIIDGVAHKMSFGEQKTVIIEGEAHTLRFGAPSRELYMGNFPFRGVFGGPPIVASINGRRHEIRLGGPPPEVKIEQDPAYELMRHMPTARQQSAAPPVKPVEPKKETLDVLGLLNKLKQTGVLNTVTEAARGDVENLRSKNIRPQKAQSPPIPCGHRLDKFEKKAAPMSSLDQFSMRSLIYRYDTVVDAIHEQRICCPHCGIGFKEKHGEAYKRHIDWHLQSLAKRDYNRCRPWFMTQNWFDFSETETVNNTVSQEAKEAAKTSNDTKDVCSEGVGLKECSECKEKFEEYWDDDSDSWRFRNSIEENGTLLHRTCMNEVKPESKD